MEPFPEICRSCGQCIAALLLRVRFSEMECRIACVERASVYFHDINLTALWPLSIVTFVLGHHPECRQEAFSAWHLCPYLKSAVLERMLALRIDSAGCIIWLAVAHFLKRLDIEHSILDVGIVRRVAILL